MIPGSRAPGNTAGATRATARADRWLRRDILPIVSAVSGPVAITIGNFDGVHHGHRRLVGEARTAVGPRGRVVVLSFDPHPAAVLRPGAAPARLTGFGRRAQLLAAAGADEVVAIVPGPEFLAQDAGSFVAAIVREHRPDFFVEGPDFRFGRDRAGSVATLRDLEAVHGFTTRVVDPVSVPLVNCQLVVASSTMIRDLVGLGRMRDAAAVLGRPYALDGIVVPGARRGRLLGLPTANIATGEFQVPGEGVYAGRAWRLDREADGWYPAAVSVGTNPTFGAHARSCETHLVGYGGPLDDYGWPIRLEIADWLRDQIRYDDVDRLVEQIRRDIAQTESRCAAAAGAS